MTAKPIYLDYMATTPIDPQVIERMLHFMGPHAEFGNPASLQHSYGQNAATAVDSARQQIAASMGANSEEMIFTSGATEANNLAIIGAARFYQRKGKHLITLATEHKSVLDSFAQLEDEGFEVTYLLPQKDGLINLDDLTHAIRRDTLLASVMHVNNEIGVIQNIQQIGQLLRESGVLFHVDAAQSAGKIAIDLSKMPIDLMSLSAHKNYGPKGIGALYVSHKPRIRLQAQSYGGEQEQGLRSGTLATHQIVGMGAAFAMSQSVLVEEQTRLLALREKLWQGIKHLSGLHLNGHPSQRVAGNLNISIEGIDGADLLPALHELAISSLSACASASHQPSYVLRALGVHADLAKSTLRISLGRFTTEKDVERTIHVLTTQITTLRQR